MDGVISFESKWGAGSIFTVVLKNVEISENLNARLSPIIDEVRESGKFITSKKVLIVDDVENNRMVLYEWLKKYGIDSESAEDGVLALEKMAKVDFCMVITDIRMPNMDGFALIKRIRESKFAMPVIAVTASIKKSDENRINELGFDDCLKKPIDIDKLIKVLRKYIPYEEKLEVSEVKSFENEGDSLNSPLTDKQVSQLKELYQLWETNDRNFTISNCKSFVKTVEITSDLIKVNV